jgi:hypothetical protein
MKSCQTARWPVTLIVRKTPSAATLMRSAVTITRARRTRSAIAPAGSEPTSDGRAPTAASAPITLGSSVNEAPIRGNATSCTPSPKHESAAAASNRPELEINRMIWHLKL